MRDYLVASTDSFEIYKIYNIIKVSNENKKVIST